MFGKFLVGLLAVTSIQVHASPIVPRTNDFKTGLLEFLRGKGLTDYAGELESWSETQPGQDFIAKLDYSKRTLYVPSNQAFERGRRTRQTGSAQPMSFSATDDGSNPGKRSNDNGEFGRLVQPTLWDDPESVNLSGRPQVQVIDIFSDDYRILRGTTTNATATTVGTFRNIYVKEIDIVVTPPLSVKDTLSAGLVDATPNGFPEFSAAAQAAGLLDDLNNRASTTIFAPISFPSNANANDVENHVLWNDVLYSTDIKDEDTTITASGKTLKFKRDYGNFWVQYGDVQARVIRSDVTTNNGVIHVIDKPLL